MSELSEASRKVMYKLLDGFGQEHEDALKELPTLPDKKSVADFLVERLSGEQDGGTRSWIVSGLAAINEPDTVDAVAARLDPGVEEFEWARYFAAIGLARMQPDDLQQHLIKAHVVFPQIASPAQPQCCAITREGHRLVPQVNMSACV